MTRISRMGTEGFLVRDREGAGRIAALRIGAVCPMNDRNTVMNERYFEDLLPGTRFASEPLAADEKQLIEFAHKFDPQMFHLDRKTAERSIFKGLVASGWHTAAMTMRLFVQTLNFAQGAIGLGVDELRWPHAVRPGDTLRVETEIIEARLSRSKPRHGIIRLRNVTTNQRGEIVQSMYANALVPRRAFSTSS